MKIRKAIVITGAPGLLRSLEQSASSAARAITAPTTPHFTNTALITRSTAVDTRQQRRARERAAQKAAR